MDLLANAIESIRAGVEDYEDGSHGRLLAAVRSIHAGILLLYKEALRRLSPAGSNEVLVKARIAPTRNAKGNVEFVGEGKKTVEVQQIKERFEGLGIATDWTRFTRITNVRNEIEHYYTKVNKKGLESVISDAFVILRNFVSIELKEDPLKLFGDDTWNAMLKVSQVYQVERAECERVLAAVSWESDTLAKGVLELTCPSCSGGLLQPNGDYKDYRDDMLLRCRACGETIRAQDFVPEAVASTLAFENYLARKDGGEIPYTTCPVCSAEAYIMNERRCAQCGEEAEHNCHLCGSKIPAEEMIGSPYCGWCAHVADKRD
jgi:hypothetical protein